MANCNQPLADISEFLREEQGDSKVDQQQNGENERDAEMNRSMGYLIFWHALT